MKGFSRFFIDRPVFAAVIAILTVLIGGVALVNLPIAQYPNITPPTVTVSANYPGANAETVANTIAAPLEQEINGVDNMLYIQSTSASDGQMSMTVTFQPGTNADTAQVLVQNRVQAAIGKLPEVVRSNGVIVRKRSPDFTMAVNIISPDATYDNLYLSNFALLQIRDQLARLDGVGEVQLFGARDYSMRIWLNPEKIATLGMTVGEVVQSLREQNIQIPAGSVGAQPAPAGLDYQYTVTTQGRLENPEQFENIVIKTGENGEVVRVKDVARVELGAKDYTIISRLDGQPAVNVGVFQSPDANALEVANRVREKMKELAPSFPPGVEYRIYYDTTIFVRESIHAVVKTIFEAFLLVVIVVLVFLQNWRSTLIPMIAVPVSLIGTFAFMQAFGFSINMLTLLGLVLAIGIVVDDAIVVVEAVDHHLASGLRPREATIKAMDEVSGPIVAMSLVLAAVFVPTAFIPGITGSFYKQFALTIAISTLLSMVNSLTLSPALCAIFLQQRNARKDVLGRMIDTGLGWFFKLFNRSFDATKTAYIGTQQRMIRRTGIVLLLYVALVGLTVFVFNKVPAGFIPEVDQGYMFVNVELGESASLERTEKVMERVEDILEKTPGVAHTIARVGNSNVSQSTASNVGTVIVIFTPFAERNGHPKQSLAGIMAAIKAQCRKEVIEARVNVFAPPPVRGLSTTGGLKMMVQDRQGKGSVELEKALKALIKKSGEMPAVDRAFTLFRASTPQIFVDVNRVQAKSLGVDINDVAQTLQYYLGSIYVNDLTLFGKPYQVTAQADGAFRQRPEDILRLQTRNAAGEMVPLGSIVNLSEVTAPARIIRFNLYPAGEVNLSPAKGYSTGEVIESMTIASKALPGTFGFEWTETALQEILAGKSAMFVFPLCVLFVFLMLAALYENWKLPLAVILIVPMCVLFSLVGVAISGGSNNIFVQIGFVVLIGLASKNAILIVEFAKLMRERGKTRVEAALEAARLRLRPILMTSFAFILGVIPLALSTGAGSEIRGALGVAVFAGMLGVTLFGLILTPVFYVVLDKLGSGEKPVEKNTGLLD